MSIYSNIQFRSENDDVFGGGLRTPVELPIFVAHSLRDDMLAQAWQAGDPVPLMRLENAKDEFRESNAFAPLPPDDAFLVVLQRAYLARNLCYAYLREILMANGQELVLNEFDMVRPRRRRAQLSSRPEQSHAPLYYHTHYGGQVSPVGRASALLLSEIADRKGLLLHEMLQYENKIREVIMPAATGSYTAHQVAASLFEAGLREGIGGRRLLEIVLDGRHSQEQLFTEEYLVLFSEMMAHARRFKSFYHALTDKDFHETRILDFRMWM